MSLQLAQAQETECSHVYEIELHASNIAVIENLDKVSLLSTASSFARILVNNLYHNYVCTADLVIQSCLPLKCWNLFGVIFDVSCFIDSPPKFRQLNVVWFALE